MSTGKEANIENVFLTQTTSSDYENLFRMDVLGLEDRPCGDKSMVHSELLKTLAQRLKKRRLDGVIQRANMTSRGREFYMPHKAVVKENAASTKTRIVYDASARLNESSPSLNVCLEVGPPLQNQLRSVLARGRFHTIALTADIWKIFLQVRIHPDDRDALRFHWLENKDLLQVCTLRFTRALFGLGLPLSFSGEIHSIICTQHANHPKQFEDIERSLYVNDILSGAWAVEEVKELKGRFPLQPYRSET